tara:strand:- start:2556 stop:2753 length:198 start_codon:yes stop_codon:yes gene_type:complete
MKQYLNIFVIVLVTLLMSYIEYTVNNNVLITIIIVCTFAIVSSLNSIVKTQKELTKTLKTWLQIR